MNNNAWAMTARLVDGFVGKRLPPAGDAPGLREAVIALAHATLETDDFHQLIRDQFQQLRSTSSTAIPDAYLADQATVEDALQRAAAGIRLAMAQNGRIVDGRTFERRIARRLGDDPRLAVRAELARIPRPLSRPLPLQWSIDPAPWANDPPADTLWPPRGLDATTDLRSLPGGPAAFAQVEDGPHAGWVQIGLVERHSTPPHRYPERPERSVLIGMGLEVADTDPPDGSLPFSSMPWQFWTAPWQRIDATTSCDTAAAGLATNDWSLVALAEYGPRRSGLGEPPFLLVPVLPLIVAFALEPTLGVCGFSLSDQAGPGLVGRLWRGHPVHDGNYEPVFPAVEGADLLLRLDLFERLRNIVGETRLCAGLSVNCHTGEDAPGTTE
jgi:hypothetical protein